ncbi:MAG: SAM-dependent methyltransferase, partial [Alphaproteobacteria bacterium]|nr:SAM-dependent methyltransferase [Alphaproteobacteria bacterium]
DPFVFGRGGEEALALAAAGVPFRIVPGVTAGIGGLAYAGIPATHRDANSAVTFVSGHAAPEESGLDWEALARGSPALVFYMALRRIGAIAGRLMAHGRPPAEPAVIVSHAATPRQHVIETTLAGLGEAAQQAEPPAVIALGPITALRPRLDWLGRLGAG